MYTFQSGLTNQNIIKLLYRCMNFMSTLVLNITCVIIIKNLNKDGLVLGRNELTYRQTG